MEVFNILQAHLGNMQRLWGVRGFLALPTSLVLLVVEGTVRGKIIEDGPRGEAIPQNSG